MGPAGSALAGTGPVAADKAPETVPWLAETSEECQLLVVGCSQSMPGSTVEQIQVEE